MSEKQDRCKYFVRDCPTWNRGGCRNPNLAIYGNISESTCAACDKSEPKSQADIEYEKRWNLHRWGIG